MKFKSFVLLVVFVISGGSCINENVDGSSVDTDLLELPVNSALKTTLPEKGDVTEGPTVLVLMTKLLKSSTFKDEVANDFSSRHYHRSTAGDAPRRTVRQALPGYFPSNPYSTRVPLYPTIGNIRNPQGGQSPYGPTYQSTNYTYPYNYSGNQHNNYYNPAQGPHNPLYKPGNGNLGVFNSSNYDNRPNNAGFYPKPPYSGTYNYNTSLNHSPRPYYSNSTNRPHSIHPNYPTPNYNPSWSTNKQNITNYNYPSTTPTYYKPAQGPYNPYYKQGNSGNTNLTNYGLWPQNNGQSPTNGFTGNSQNIPYNPNQQPWNFNSTFPTNSPQQYQYPGQNGANTFRLANSYYPSVPNQPPYNGNVEQNHFYYPGNRNTTWHDPTKY
ncbi:sporozoite surface protein 2-like [Bombyx mandarina]|uniref:Sporozoite surface protein 2-like n=1 Tax=Bombyx mandarina TaxID=7092 RepID=A0A6J2KHZ7_BOMMA|nr:sporozoite surface protein 2-like [Bombyx mandarina]